MSYVRSLVSRRHFFQGSLAAVAMAGLGRFAAACSNSERSQNADAIARIAGTFGVYTMRNDGLRQIDGDNNPRHEIGSNLRLWSMQRRFLVPTRPQPFGEPLPVEIPVFPGSVPQSELSARLAKYPPGMFSLEGENRISAYMFGVCFNGTPCEGGAGYWKANPAMQWEFNPLQGEVAKAFEIDANRAHINHVVGYHYHGDPEQGVVRLLREAGYDPNDVLVGFAADGFPMYRNGSIDSSYVLRQGQRPEGAPQGAYNGDFCEDYVFQPGKGPLDELNGMMMKTKEFPQGTYAYFLTRSFPGVPRAFRGVPHASFGYLGGALCAEIPPDAWSYGGRSEAEVAADKAASPCEALRRGRPA